MDRESVLRATLEPGVPLVCVTGGEPLLQQELPEFLEELIEKKTTVLLETGGSRNLSDVPEEVIKIVDVKTPGALMKGGYSGGEISQKFLKTHFHYPNLDLLNPHDEIKFVVTSRADYDWTLEFIQTHQLSDRVGEILLSPSHGQVTPSELVEWMQEDSFPGRLNLQVHKYIWGLDVRGV